MTEFSGYGSQSNTVKKMVNNNDINICTKFFKCDINNIKQFNINFFNVLNIYKKQQNSKYIIPCFIELWDTQENKQGTKHAIILLIENKYRFLFDPNGEVLPCHRYSYYNKNTNTIFTSKELFNKYNVETSKGSGIQSTAPGTPSGKTKYIGYGGYCMFYVRQALEILENSIKKNKSIILTGRELSSISGRKYFSSTRNIGRDSLKMVKRFLPLYTATKQKTKKNQRIIGKYTTKKII
jgi:hypothetical protein